MVQLSINGKPKGFLVHRLVAEAFCEKPEGCDIVDHIDRDKYNNHYTNLRWVDISTNNSNKEYSRSSKREYVETLPEIGEEWQPIPGNKDYLINRSGQVLKKIEKRFLNPNIRNGYLRYSIASKNYSAHILVWETFVGPVEKGMYIDHIDGNKSNNHLSNLRQVSQSENMKNAYRNGHRQQVGVSKYSLSGEFIAHYNSLRAAAEEVDVSDVAIRTASTRLGSSAGFFWIRDDQDISIEVILEKAKNKSTQSVPIIQLDLEGNEIARFPSMTAAAKQLDISLTSLFAAVYNNREFYGYRYVRAQD